MPAPVTIIRPAHGPTATIAAPEYNAETVVSAAVRDATELLPGVVKFAAAGVALPLVAPQANDPRLSDARPPVAHSHPPSDVNGLAELIAAAVGAHILAASLTVSVETDVLIPLPDDTRAGLFILQASNPTLGSITQLVAFTLDYLDSDLVHLSDPIQYASARGTPISDLTGVTAARILVTADANTFLSWAFLRLPIS